MDPIENYMQDGSTFWGWLYYVGHTFSPIAVIGSLWGFLPGTVAIVALLFYLLQMYESVTCQTWLHTRRLRKIAALKIKMAVLEAQEKKADAWFVAQAETAKFHAKVAEIKEITKAQVHADIANTDLTPTIHDDSNSNG